MHCCLYCYVHYYGILYILAGVHIWGYYVYETGKKSKALDISLDFS